MEGSATVHMAAPADKIWELIADIRNTGRFSPEVFEAEWLGGATGPSVGATFRGHVKRNGIGPTYWTTCTVRECEPGRTFTFGVGPGDQPLTVDIPDAAHVLLGGEDIAEAEAHDDAAA